MGSKYSNLETDIYSIFDTTKWKSEGILTKPNNYTSSNNSDEFLRITVIPSGKSVNKESVSGLLLIEIFVSAGKGSKRAFEIADTLDQYLEGKTLKTNLLGSTQFTFSVCAPDGYDKDDPSLYRYEYNISFNYFGVQ